MFLMVKPHYILPFFPMTYFDGEDAGMPAPDAPAAPEGDAAPEAPVAEGDAAPEAPAM